VCPGEEQEQQSVQRHEWLDLERPQSLRLVCYKAGKLEEHRI
jgi:hypothetical protein